MPAASSGCWRAETSSRGRRAASRDSRDKTRRGEAVAAVELPLHEQEPDNGLRTGDEESAPSSDHAFCRRVRWIGESSSQTVDRAFHASPLLSPCRTAAARPCGVLAATPGNIGENALFSKGYHGAFPRMRLLHKRKSYSAGSRQFHTPVVIEAARRHAFRFAAAISAILSWAARGDTPGSASRALPVERASRLAGGKPPNRLSCAGRSGQRLRGIQSSP